MDNLGVVSLVEAFEASLERGRDLAGAQPRLVRERTELGETALHLLVLGHSVEAVRELVKLGADINALCELGTTPLSDAASNGDGEIVSFLLQSGALVAVEGQRDPTLHQAVRGGNIEVVRLILDAGADVNQQADLAEAPIHIAVQADDLAMAKLLLSRGADPMLKRIFDETALDVARDVGSDACIELLSTRH